MVTLFLNEILGLICLHTVKWFQVFLSNTKNFLLILIICLYVVKSFQVLLFNIRNSIYQVFLCDINYLHTAEWVQIVTLSKWLNNSIWFIDGTLTGTINRLVYIIGQVKILQYFSNMSYNSAASDTFKDVKMTNYIGLWYTKFAWYSLHATHRIYLYGVQPRNPHF